MRKSERERERAKVGCGAGKVDWRQGERGEGEAEERKKPLSRGTEANLAQQN